MWYFSFFVIYLLLFFLQMRHKTLFWLYQNKKNRFLIISPSLISSTQNTFWNKPLNENVDFSTYTTLKHLNNIFRKLFFGPSSITKIKPQYEKVYLWQKMFRTTCEQTDVQTNRKVKNTEKRTLRSWIKDARCDVHCVFSVGLTTTQRQRHPVIGSFSNN